MNGIFKNCLGGLEVTAVAEAVRHRPLTSEVQVETQVSPCDVCGGQNVSRAGSSKKYLRFPLSCVQCFMLIIINVSLTTKTSWRSLGTFQRATLFLEIGDHWTEKNLTFSSG